MFKPAGNINDAIEKIRTLLAEGKPQEAMEVVSANQRSKAKVLINAHAVCLMRLGHYEEAVKLLRGLVYPGVSFAMAPDAPEIAKTNLATVLMLSGNVDGAQAVLKQIDARSNPMAVRLNTTIVAWKQKLSLFQRLQCLWGNPNVPVPLDFPPGEL